MKIVYIGTNNKTIPGFNKILKPGVVITDDKLVESLKHRPDFHLVKDPKTARNNYDHPSFGKKRGTK